MRITAKVDPQAMTWERICVPERQKTALLTRLPKLLSLGEGAVSFNMV